MIPAGPFHDRPSQPLPDHEAPDQLAPDHDAPDHEGRAIQFFDRRRSFSSGDTASSGETARSVLNGTRIYHSRRRLWPRPPITQS
jgi:hypothetical protein